MATEVEEIRAVLTAEIGNLQSEMRRAADAIDALGRKGTQSIGSASKAADGLTASFRTLRSVLGPALAALGARELIATADAAKLLDARLRNATNGSQEFARAQAEVFRISQETGISVQSTAEVYTRFANATRGLGVSQQDLLSVTETLNKAIVVSGASAQEAHNGLIQLSQGMASGVLRGQDLRAVLEDIPTVGRLIADGLGVSIGKLRELGEQGKLTTEQIIGAIKKASSEVEAPFSKIPLTVGRAITQVQNAFLGLVSQLDQATGGTGALAQAISDLAKEMSDPAFVAFARDIIGAIVSGVTTATHVIEGLVLEAGQLIGTLQKLYLLASDPLNFETNLSELKDSAGGLLTAFRFPELHRNLSGAINDFEEYKRVVDAVSKAPASIQLADKGDLDALAQLLPHIVEDSNAAEQFRAALKRVEGSLDSVGKTGTTRLNEVSKAVLEARKKINDILSGLSAQEATAGLSELEQSIAKTREQIRKAAEDETGNLRVSLDEVTAAGDKAEASLRNIAAATAAVDFSKTLRASSIEELTAGLRGLDAEVEKTRLNALFDQLDKGVPFQVASTRADLLAQSLRKVQEAGADIRIGDQLRDFNNELELLNPGLDDFDKRIIQGRQDLDKLFANGEIGPEEYARRLDLVKTKIGEIREASIAAKFDLVNQFADALDKVVEGFLTGTRKIEDILGGLKDIGVSIFADMFKETIKEKVRTLDSGFRGNLLTDIPNMFSTMSKSVLGIFGDLFQGILGQKTSILDSGLQAVTGNSSSSVSGLLTKALGLAASSGAGSYLSGLSGLLSGVGAGSLGTAGYGVLASSIGPSISEALVNLGLTPVQLGATSYGVLASDVAGGATSAAASAASTAGSTAAASSFELTSGQIYALLPAIAGILGAALQKSASPQLQATGRGLSKAATPLSSNPFSKAGVSNPGGNLQETFEGLLIGGPGGQAFASALGLDIFGHQISKGQSARRFIGNEILGGLTSISQLNPNFDPYKSGITSIGKANAAFPDLFKQAGPATQALGTVLSASLKSGQSDAKEFNFVVSTLIDNLGKAGTTGPDAVTRVAAAFRELNISADQAGAIIQDAFAKGQISQQQFQTSLAGLAQVSQVSVGKMVSVLKAGLNDQGKQVFDKLVASGADAWQSVLAASSDAFQKIALGLSSNLLPNAVAVFTLIKSIGIQSAEDIQRAFEGISAGAAQFPGGNSGAPGFFVGGKSGKLIYGSYQNGQFVPAPAPETTGPDQVKLRTTSPKIPGFAVGGFVAVGGLAEVHPAERVLSAEQNAIFERLAAGLESIRTGGASPQIHVVAVTDRDQLPAALYRLQRENRYILPSGEQVKPAGVR